MFCATKLSKFFIIQLFIITIIDLSSASPHLTPITGIEWNNVTDSSEAYYDAATSQKWITFKTEIAEGDWNSSIENDVDGMIRFKWRSDVKIAEGKFRRSIKFYKNSSIELFSSKPGMSEIKWESEAPFYYNRQNNYALNFMYPRAMSGTIWIAFPPEQPTNVSYPEQPTNVSYPEQPTNVSYPEQLTKPKFNISSDGILWFGNALRISANSTDPNNDNINYSWEWGDETPNGNSSLIPSGKDATQRHYYENPGFYKISITASNSKGNNSSSTINLTVLSPRPPETPHGECIGYIDVNYTYSANLNVSLLIKNVRFLFNITDGASDQIVNSESNSSAEIIQRWLNNGAKKVKASALDIQGNPSNWSEPINVDIYIPITVNDSQDLQKEIDDASNYTEISLVDEVYNVGEVLIERKDHLTLKSSRPRALLTSNQDVIQRLKIDSSTFINIYGLQLNKTDYCLTMDNCSRCKVKDCDFEFQHDGAGIGIKLGVYNEFENNQLWNKIQNNSSGLIIDKSSYNIIKNNYINFSSPSNHYCHIWFIAPHVGNRIIRTSQKEELRIKMDEYIIVWGEKTGSIVDCSCNGAGTPCPMSVIDCIMDTIEVINDMELIYAD
jgi:hypothetical protein